MSCCNCNSTNIRNPTNEENTTIEFTGLTMPETVYTAICILNGMYGNGGERIQNLRKIHTETHIKEAQDIVNLLATYWD